jgi:hypothetical protein
MSNSYFGFYFGVGENLTGHGLPNPNTVNNSYTGDLRLMGSVGDLLYNLQQPEPRVECRATPQLS